MADPRRNSRRRKSHSRPRLDVIAEASDETSATPPPKTLDNPQGGVRQNYPLPQIEPIRGRKKVRNMNYRSSSYDDLLRHQQAPPVMMTDRSSSPERGRHAAAGRQPRRREFHESCFHPQSRICSNLKHSLIQLRSRSERDPYSVVVEAVASGPETVTNAEAERILGIDKHVFQKSRSRRKVFHSFDDDEENDEEDVPGLSRMDPMTFTDRGLVAVGPTTMRPNGGIYLPRLPQPGSKPKNDDSSSEVLGSGGLYKNKRTQTVDRTRPALRELFANWSRFGEPHSTGRHITLTQSDQWLKQAGILDNWNVTVTDTAISFRKISRGSKLIDYETWRLFLEEFAWRKRIHHDFMLDKLAQAGKPSQYQIWQPKQLCAILQFLDEDRDKRSRYYDSRPAYQLD